MKVITDKLQERKQQREQYMSSLKYPLYMHCMSCESIIEVQSLSEFKITKEGDYFYIDCPVCKNAHPIIDYYVESNRDKMWSKIRWAIFFIVMILLVLLQIFNNVNG